jgi:hypothetical protein
LYAAAMSITTPCRLFFTLLRELVPIHAANLYSTCNQLTLNYS